MKKKWYENWNVVASPGKITISLPNSNLDPNCEEPLVIKFNDKTQHKFKRLFGILLSAFDQIQRDNGGYLKGGEIMPDTFRKEYTELNEEQKEQMASVKEAAENLETLFNGFVPAEERSERSRCVALARTKLEESILWAIKGITTKV